jgi:hypothetical protein
MADVEEEEAADSGSRLRARRPGLVFTCVFSPTWNIHHKSGEPGWPAPQPMCAANAAQKSNHNEPGDQS